MQMKLQVQLVYMMDSDAPKDKYLLKNGHFDFIFQPILLPKKWICIRIERDYHRESSYMIGELYTLYINRLTNKITLISTGKFDSLFAHALLAKMKELDSKGQRDTGFILTKKPLKLNQFMTYIMASYKKD